MWLPSDIIRAVDARARIHYIDARMTASWNAHRRQGELRLLTGWAWVSREGGAYRLGFKTQTVCYRDAYYALIAKSNAPGLSVRPRLRVVA